MIYNASERCYRKESGTALISVLLIFAICSVLAIEMQSRQYLDIRRTTNILSQDQAYLYTAAAEEIAIDTLNEDLKKDNKNGTEKDHLKEGWHKEKSFPLDGGAITASLEDLQGKFNINTLLTQDPDQAADALRVFQALMTDLGLPKSEEDFMPVADMATVVLEWMDQNDQSDQRGGLVEGEDYYYQGLETPYRTSNSYLNNISELRLIRGFTDQDIAELEPYLSFLPPDVAINLNTLDEKVAAHLMTDGGDIVTNRPEQGYNDVGEANLQQSNPPANFLPLKLNHQVFSEYFLLTATVTINERTITHKSVIFRPRSPDKDNRIRVIMRDRGRKFHYQKKPEQPI